VGDDDPSHRPASAPNSLPAPAEITSRLRVVDEDHYSGWDEIYLDNAVRVYRLMYAKVGNRPDAEDLTTEVFLAALGPLRTAASRGEIRAYLAATARTVLARYWRNRLGAEATVIEIASAVEFLNDPPAETQAIARAHRVLDSLPHRYRSILELRFLRGLSIKDSARELGVSVTNAKVLQHRALRMAAKAEEGWAT
jgi:RNA polymerase sigma factor (sigma-70 family)